MTSARLLAVQSDPTCPPGRVGRWLADSGLGIDVVRADRGEPVPTSLPDHDGLLVLGGAVGSTDDHRAPWLPGLRSLTRELVEADRPVLGLCLGLQIIASACGGRVGLEEVPEFGLGEIDLTEAGRADPVVGLLPERAVIPQFHRDGVLEPPPGSVVLATSPRCSVQLLRMGTNVYATQGHPEVDGDLFAPWVDFEEADILDGSGADPDRAVADLRAAEGRLEQMWRPVFAAWAGRVRAHAGGTAPLP